MTLIENCIKQHEERIEILKRDNLLYTKDINKYLKRINEKDFSGHNTEQYLWGLIYAESDRICCRLKEIKEHEELIEKLKK